MGGTSGMAHAFTQRVIDRHRPEKVPVLAWLMMLVAPVAAVIFHVLLVAVYLMLRPLPHVAVFWLPVVVGCFVGFGLFSALTRSILIEVPKWGSPLVIVVGLALSTLPMLIVQQKYAVKVRQSLIRQVDEQLMPPYLPADTAKCVLVSIPERAKDGDYTFQATLKSGQSHLLGATVELFRASLIRDKRMENLQCVLAESIMDKPLKTCVGKYPHLKTLSMQEFSVTATTQAGAYVGKIVFDDMLSLSFLGRCEADGFRCRLEPESRIRALAIPLATALWRRFAPASEETCLDVKLGETTSAGLRISDAILAGGESIPVVVEAASDADDAAVSVFFQFREETIVEINTKLQEVAELKGDVFVRRCVNVDKKEQLRDQEFSLRALFPEGDPLVVLARQQGRNVSIVPREHVVMLAPSARLVDKSWSLLVPAHYRQDKGSEFVRVVKSDSDKLLVSLESKPVNVHSKFDLQEYAMNERTRWAEGRTAVEIGEIAPFETTSGLFGYRYDVRKGRALRSKYFFMHGANLAIISATSTEAEHGLLEKADEIVATLRFKDVADEALSGAGK
jgi:hypothetical protein